MNVLWIPLQKNNTIYPTINNLSMGCAESIMCTDEKRYKITPKRIPYPFDSSLRAELKKSGIIFKDTHSILKHTQIWYSHNYETINRIVDICLPKGFGIIKIDGKVGKLGYYLVNDKHTAICYMYKDNTHYPAQCMIESLPNDNIKREVDVNKYGLYKGWWLPHDDIKKKYMALINNYKKNLEIYNSYANCDSVMINKEYDSILNKYNTLIKQVPEDMLLSNNIRKPLKLKSVEEQVFI